MHDASPDASLQALAAEAIVEPPTMPPLYHSAEGDGELTLGADGVPAPWQRRQRRRLGLASSSASAMSAAPAMANVGAESDTAAPPADGSVSRLAYLRARLAANAARRRMTKCVALVCRTLVLASDTDKRKRSHWLRLLFIHSSQVVARGVVYPLIPWRLGLGVVQGCFTGCSDCVALAHLHDASWCMFLHSQGSRWASGQTSPRQGKVAYAAGCMHFHCRYVDALSPLHGLILCSSLHDSIACESLLYHPVAMGTSKASKRRQANRPGRRERAAERGGEPAADAEAPSSEEDHAPSSSQLVDPAPPFSETLRQCSSSGASAMAWTVASDVICRHATLVPPIPVQLRAQTMGSPARDVAALSPHGVMDTYMPVPEGLSFDHLDTLGTIGPHTYHLPFQDTLIPWSRRWLWGLRSPPALDDSAEYVAGCVSDQRVAIYDVPHIRSDSSPELIPAAEGLCSTFCLEEDPETEIITAKMPRDARLLVPLYHCFRATGLALQGPGPPQPQAGAVLHFCTYTCSSSFRRRRGGHVQAHSTALCTCLGPWKLHPAPGFVRCALSHSLRFGITAAHSRRGGNTILATSLATIDAAWQTTPCCNVLLPACGDHSVHWEAGASTFIHHTGDASGPCSGGSDCSDRQRRHRISRLTTCPAPRLAQSANALPPLSLRRVLRRKPSPRRPQCEDGSTPVSTSFYRKRGGVLRTHRISWPRPRRNWNLSPDLTFLNAYGCCRKDVISLGSCRHFGRDSVFATVDVLICYRRLHPRAPALGSLYPPMVKESGPRRPLPLAPGRVLLVVGHEWRRGSAGCCVRTFLYLLGGRSHCNRRSICLRPTQEHLALIRACLSVISVLRNPVRTLSLLDGAAFSHIARDVGHAHLPFVRGTALLLNDHGQRPGKNGLLSCFQALAGMPTQLYLPSCIDSKLSVCLCPDRIARSRRFKPFFLGRAANGLLPLLTNGRELGRRCSYRSSTSHCPALHTRDWGAYYCRPASTKRNVSRRGRRHRRRRAAPCRPPCGWLLHYRWHTLRVSVVDCHVHCLPGPAVPGGTGDAGACHCDGAPGYPHVDIVDHTGVRPLFSLLLALPVRVLARISHLQLASAVRFHCHW